ncbi:hypothetical protein Y032_0708g1711 [Ancylostoma ceylanicum]|uniref:Proteolipid membrane potential modulator n=1 Tax=Ancylostoma ceylanicum TaxID=53326 RepID=A0A016WH43_9BILA|nr:hypothetical protein Y032_0708g1711 [Ancylostoma ceylanicum]
MSRDQHSLRSLEIDNPECERVMSDTCFSAPLAVMKGPSMQFTAFTQCATRTLQLLELLKSDMGSSDTDKIIEILLILLLPPLAVWFHDRACSCAVCINIILLFLFVLPAIIHAVWYCYMRD